VLSSKGRLGDPPDIVRLAFEDGMQGRVPNSTASGSMANIEVEKINREHKKVMEGNKSVLA